MDEQWSAGCACGWQFTGTQDEAVAAVMDHAGRVHNMTTTREAVLPSLVRVGDAPPVAASDGSTSRPPAA
jgi:predicted small metal-binding protein